MRAVIYNDSRGGYINNVPSTFTRSANDYGIYYAGYATGCSVGTPTNGACGAGSKATAYGPPPGSAAANNYSIAANAINPVTYKGMRLSALWQINDDWSALVTETYQAMEADGVFYQMPHGSDYGVNPSAPQVLAPLSATVFSPSYDKDKWDNTALTINGKIGDIKLVYSGGYLSRTIDQVNDYTNYTRGVFADYYQCYGLYAGSPTCFAPNAYWKETETNTHQSHEFRLSTPDDKRIRGLVGAFYEDYKITDDTDWSYKTVPTCTTGGSPDCFQNVQPVTGSVVGNPNPRNDNVAFFEDTHRDIKQTAFFASVDVDLIPKVLTLTAGTRHFDYKEDFGGTVVSSFGCFNYAATPTVGPCTNFKYSANISGYNLNAEFKGFKSRANLTWHVTPDTMVYYTWSQGYRPGGFNRSTGYEANDANGIPQYVKPLTVQPDSLTNNEIGFKSEFLNRRVQLNGSIYDEKWQNVQTAIFNPQYFGNTTFGLNGPDYEVKGIELQLTARVTTALTVIASGSWNRSQQTTSPPLVDNNCAGNALRNLLPTTPVSPTCGQPITQLVEPNGKLGNVTNTFGSTGVPTAFSPPLQYNVRARYDFAMADYGAFWQVGMVHMGHSYNNSNTDPTINGDVLWPAGQPVTTTALAVRDAGLLDVRRVDRRRQGQLERAGVRHEHHGRQREPVHLDLAVRQGGGSDPAARAGAQDRVQVLSTPVHRRQPASAGCSRIKGGQRCPPFSLGAHELPRQFRRRLRSRPKCCGSAASWSGAGSPRRWQRPSASPVEVPQNRDVLYMIAVSQRYLKRIHGRRSRPSSGSSGFHPALQPPVPGARPLLRGAARCAERDRGVPQGREPQSGAAGELGDAGEAVRA